MVQPIKLKTDICKQCGHGKDPERPWIFRVEFPRRCPNCGSSMWDREPGTIRFGRKRHKLLITASQLKKGGGIRAQTNNGGYLNGFITELTEDTVVVDWKKGDRNSFKINSFIGEIAKGERKFWIKQ